MENNDKNEVLSYLKSIHTWSAIIGVYVLGKMFIAITKFFFVVCTISNFGKLLEELLK